MPRAHQPGRQPRASPPLLSRSLARSRRGGGRAEPAQFLDKSLACRSVRLLPGRKGLPLASPSSAARAAFSFSPTRESVSPVEARVFGAASARDSIPGLVRQRRREGLEGGTLEFL